MYCVVLDVYVFSVSFLLNYLFMYSESQYIYTYIFTNHDAAGY